MSWQLSRDSKKSQKALIRMPRPQQYSNQYILHIIETGHHYTKPLCHTLLFAQHNSKQCSACKYCHIYTCVLVALDADNCKCVTHCLHAVCILWDFDRSKKLGTKYTALKFRHTGHLICVTGYSTPRGKDYYYYHHHHLFADIHCFLLSSNIKHFAALKAVVGKKNILD